MFVVVVIWFSLHLRVMARMSIVRLGWKLEPTSPPASIFLSRTRCFLTPLRPEKPQSPIMKLKFGVIGEPALPIPLPARALAPIPHPHPLPFPRSASYVGKHKQRLLLLLL